MTETKTNSRIGLNILRVALALGFIGAGIMHFVKESMFVSIMPDWLPAYALLVQISGIAEVLGGIGLLIGRTRKLAAFGLILLLVAVFPTNINMALNAQKFPQIPASALWARLPFQFVFIWLVWLCRK